MFSIQEVIDSPATAAAEIERLAARLAEAERLLTRVIVDGDFVAENVLYVYGETFGAIEKFLGRTARELVKSATVSATGQESVSHD